MIPDLCRRTGINAFFFEIFCAYVSFESYYVKKLMGIHFLTGFNQKKNSSEILKNL